MRIFKKKLIITTLLLLMSFFITNVSMADNLESWSTVLDTTAGSDAAGYANTTTVESLVGTIITAVLSLLGVIFLVLMIYGGFIWMMARGNETEVEKAQGIIRGAIIGLAIVLAAYAISYFVVNSLTSTTLSA